MADHMDKTMRPDLRVCALLWLPACTEDIHFPIAAVGSETPVANVDARAARCDVELAATDGFTPPMAAASSCANTLFDYALCTCGDLKLPMPLETDAYDSRLGSYAPGKLGASVGTNARLTSASGLDIGGSLIVAGSSESVVFVGAPSRVADNLQLNADLSLSAAQLTVDRDLRVNGRILTLGGAVHVAGQIYQPSTADNAGEIEASAGLRTEPVTVAPPCACANTDPIDYALMAERLAANSDNAAHNLPLDALHVSRELTLPCGRYFFAGGTAATQRWATDSRAVVFIDGDLELTAPLQVELGAHGELDVFVHGSLILGAMAEVVATRPAALRFYVSGAEPILVPTSAPLSCSLYAPNAPLRTQDQQTLMGAFVVSELIAPVALTVHYDAAAQSACASSCAADGDCGAPRVCEADSCIGLRP
jgi:hypothetical protein